MNNKIVIKFIFLILFSIYYIEAKNYICTWMYCDSPEEESLFTNTSKILSSNPEFQEIYWRCACVMFASSKKVNPDCEHIIFTNKINPPDKYLNFFHKHNIRIITLPMTYQTPKKYYHAFRNTMYLFDLIKFMSQYVNSDDNVMFLDSDCVWLKSGKHLFQEAAKRKILIFCKIYPEDYKIFDLSRLDCKEIYKDLLGTQVKDTPKHFGGGIHVYSKEFLIKISSEFDNVWNAMMKRFKSNKKKFHTEEHFLSYIYYKLNITRHDANKYLNIIWTPLEKVTGKEINYTIWHLPSEKKKGFATLFDSLFPNSEFWRYNDQDFVRFCSRHFSLKLF